MVLLLAVKLCNVASFRFCLSLSWPYGDSEFATIDLYLMDIIGDKHVTLQCVISTPMNDEVQSYTGVVHRVGRSAVDGEGKERPQCQA